MSKNEAKKSTTIAINIADSALVEEYCKKHGILKKDFVGLAVKWFKDNDVDIRSEVSFVPVRAEQNNEVKALCTLMAEFITAQKQLPSNDNHDLKDVLQQQMAENESLRKNLREADRQLELAKVELRRLRKGIFNTPDEGVLNDLGIY